MHGHTYIKFSRRTLFQGVAYCVSVRALLPVRMMCVELQGSAKTVRTNKKKL